MNAIGAGTNELVNEALKRWSKLVNVMNWSVQEDLDTLNESRKYDPTGLTTFMLLRGMAESQLKTTAFNAYDVILNPEKIEKKVAPMRALRDVLEKPEVTSLIDDFEAEIEMAITSYGVPEKQRKAIDKIFKDKLHFGYMRRAALHSINTLKPYQFVQGETDPDSLKYNKKVWEFWNMNSVLEALMAQKFPGITLIMIRDPAEVFASFFAFAIRNGDNITILTDREKGAHPKYNQMSRRPDRAMDERAARHYFPYKLLGFKISADQKRLFANARNELVPHNASAAPLQDVAKLEGDEILWLVMMFDLIRDRYWKKNLQLKELAYTGEMMIKPHVLIGPGSELVKAKLYKPLAITPYKKGDITTKSTARQWERKATGFNNWMVERYGGKVPEEVLNAVGNEGLVRAEKSLEKIEKDLVKSDSQQHSRGLDTFSAVSFGTKKEIEEDRQWYARFNRMAPIQRLAEAEYDREKPKALKWFEKKVRDNDAFILEGIARGELILPEESWYEPGFVTRRKPKRKNSDALSCGEGRNFYAAFKEQWYYGSEFTFVLGSDEQCYLRPQKPTLFYIIEARSPSAIAALAGVKVSELSFGLQQAYRDEPYDGNWILDRLDPGDWALHSPWMDLRITIGVCLTKRAVNDLKKRFGVQDRK